MNSSPKKPTNQEVKEYYNDFKRSQENIGINVRHRTILKNLKALGLRSDSKVLEIGCGIGTVSGLIIKQIPNGKFTGVDISEGSIEFARKRYTGNNIEFIVSDMSNFSSSVKYDFVVLPDVLEHIPVEHHSNLFRIISENTTAEGSVLINIPEPNCLDWMRQHHPDKLQIIDQSLSMQDLLNNSYPHGFKLFAMHSYALQFTNDDYTCVILKKKMGEKKYVKKSKLALGVQNLLSKL